MSPVNVLARASTTTVFITEPTSASTSKIDNRNKIPAGAIAGGTVAGVVLALVILWLWKVWGRSIKQSDAKKKKETDALRITKQNTLRNAYTFSSPHSYSYKPLFWPPSETKVKFATPGDSSIKNKGLILQMPHETPVTKPSRPKPLRSSSASKTSKVEIPATDEVKAPAPAQLSPKPSNISSTATYYSVESAEERSKQSPFHSLVAALGNFSSDAVQHPPRTSQLSGNRLSMTSNWSLFSRSTRGTQNRYSQATSTSAYSQSDAQSSVVGIAH